MSRREIPAPQFDAESFNELSPDDQARAVGWNLRVLRKRARLTAKDLAALLERRAPDQAVRHGMLGEIERGNRRLSLELALALAKALRIDPRALFVLPAESVDPLSEDSLQLADSVLSGEEGDTADAA